jgi:hypothetical protein
MDAKMELSVACGQSAMEANLIPHLYFEYLKRVLQQRNRPLECRTDLLYGSWRLPLPNLQLATPRR